MKRRSLMQQTLDTFAQCAAEGKPLPDDWTCGLCKGPAPCYPRWVPDKAGGPQPDGEWVPLTGPGDRAKGEWDADLICPCCSFEGCPHREAAAA